MAQILIVDDEKIALTMLESLLKKQGHQVTTATDAMDALEKVKLRPIALVITDARMPGSSGFELVRHLRRDPELKSLKILFLTGLREKKDVERALQAGVDGYLVKPIDPKVLQEKVESLLASVTAAKDAAPPAVEVLFREEAMYVQTFQIVDLSVEGLSLHTTQPFHPGSQVQIEAACFTAAGVKTPLLKILKCLPLLDEAGKFVVRTSFVNVDEDFRTALRTWLEARPKAS